MNKQHRIVNLVRSEYERASEAYQKANAEHAAAIAGANAWDDFHKDDGVGSFSQNPYDVDSASKKEVNAHIYMMKMKEAYDFCVDTFLEEENE